MNFYRTWKTNLFSLFDRKFFLVFRPSSNDNNNNEGLWSNSQQRTLKKFYSPFLKKVLAHFFLRTAIEIIIPTFARLLLLLPVYFWAFNANPEFNIFYEYYDRRKVKFFIAHNKKWVPTTKKNPFFVTFSFLFLSIPSILNKRE